MISVYKQQLTDLTEKEDGFNLIEVMIAIVILAVGILGLAMMQITAIDSNTQANATSIAINQLTERLELLINEDDANIASGEDPDNPNITWTVGAGAGGTTAIIVSVQYYYKGKPRTLSAEYLRADDQYVK